MYSTRMDGPITVITYSIDRPINFHLYWYVLKHNAWFAFCHVIRMSVTCKLGRMTLMLLFSLTVVRNYNILGVNDFVVNTFFGSFV